MYTQTLLPIMCGDFWHILNLTRNPNGWESWREFGQVAFATGAGIIASCGL